MRLALDNHYSPAIAAQLRERGHDVIAVIDRGWEAEDDEPLLELCVREQRVLMSNNVADFAVIVRRWTAEGRRHPGLVFTSDASMSRGQDTIGRFVEALDKLLQSNPGDDAFHGPRSLTLAPLGAQSPACRPWALAAPRVTIRSNTAARPGAPVNSSGDDMHSQRHQCPGPRVAAHRRRGRTAVLAAVALAAAALGTGGVGQAAFPGPLGKIVFQSTRDGPRPQIYVMNFDGSRQTNITNDFGNPYFTPTWSANGTRIAVARSSDIYVMDAGGSGLTRVTTSGSNPSWAPNGQQLAFQRDLDIWATDVDGANPVELTGDPRTEVGPAWSPNGAEIAFAANWGGHLDVWKMAPDGLGAVNVSNDPVRAVSPEWSPDGSKIAFVSSRDGNDEIYVMDADGSDQIRLTNNTVFDGHPAWSPDGTKIAFASRRAGPDSDVYVMNADGSSVIRLTTSPGDDQAPDWGPDLAPPAEPTFSATDPPSPARFGEPKVIGDAEIDSTVRIYRDASCAGDVAVTGPASQFAAGGLPVPVVDEGTHTFYATATDLAGNVSACSTDSITYVLDLTMPHTTIDSGPPEGEQTTDRTPTFTFSANEPVARFECGLDGSQLFECSSPWTPDQDLDDGDHLFLVRAVDPAGNAEDSPATRSFTVRPEECSTVWIPLPEPLPDVLPPEAPDAVCA